MTISKEDIYVKGVMLRHLLLEEYRDKYLDKDWKVLIHSPRNGAWLYGFQSWLEVLEYMGISTTIVHDINNPPPNPGFDILINPADLEYMWTIDNMSIWGIPHKIGMASKQNTFLTNSFCTAWDFRNIEMIKEARYEFLITSFSRDFINYVLREWVDTGIKIVEVPFGFNPILDYPEDNEEIFDYFFVGTNSPYKLSETKRFLTPIIRDERRFGILCGTQWGEGIIDLRPGYSRPYYSKAKINLNYHIREQKMLDSEINERTFVISACGGFQLVDNPKAMSRFYSTEDMAIAEDEKDYMEKFEYYLNKPEERHEMAMKALIKSYENKYSLFHRIESILNKI